jgi:alkanesulfonate monooxygenase SsuD/methylene tetrahydromethanopterin reductase-like flavin-dependent oxidoreductase (luciferase family)
MGIKREHMVGHLRECLEIVTGVSADTSLNYDGRYYKTWGYKLPWIEQGRPLIYVASNHPQTMRLAARMADGVMTSDFCLPLMRDWIKEIHAALDELDRPRSEFRISNFWAWHIKEDPDAAWREARRELILRGYLGEHYFRSFLSAAELQTMTAHFDDFLEAWKQGSDEIAGVPEELVEKMLRNISFVGGLDAIDAAVQTLREFERAGLTEIALRVHDDPADAIELIGRHVVPALAA